MNKLFTKIAKWVLGLSMAIGVGTGISLSSKGINQAWAEEESIELCVSLGKALAYGTAYTFSVKGITFGCKGVYRQSATGTTFQMNKNSGYFRNDDAIPGTITKIETKWSAAKGPTKCYFANNHVATSSDTTVTVSAGTSVTYTPPSTIDANYFNIDVSSGSGSAQMTSCLVYYASGSVKKLTGISIKNGPTKTTYMESQTFVPTGLTITATYNDETTEDISYDESSSNFEFEPSLETKLKPSDSNVKIKYKGAECNQIITVNPISISGTAAKYTVISTSSVTAENAFTGSTAIYSQSFNTACQATADNYLQLELSGYSGTKINGLVLSMKSNTSSGKGKFYCQIGNTKCCQIDPEAPFSEWFNMSGYSTTYLDVKIPFDSPVTVKDTEKITIRIDCTVKSLYCQSYTVYYDESSSPSVSSVTILSKPSSVAYNESVTTSARITFKNGDTGLSKNINWSCNPDGGVTFSKDTSESEEEITITGVTAGDIVIKASSEETPTKFDTFTLNVTKVIKELTGATYIKKDVVQGSTINPNDVTVYVKYTDDSTGSVKANSVTASTTTLGENKGTAYVTGITDGVEFSYNVVNGFAKAYMDTINGTINNPYDLEGVCVGTNGGQAFIQNGEYGICYYKTNHGISLGQKVTLTDAEMVLYNNFPEAQNATLSKGSIEDIPTTYITNASDIASKKFSTSLSFKNLVFKSIQIVSGTISRVDAYLGDDEIQFDVYGNNRDVFENFEVNDKFNVQNAIKLTHYESSQYPDSVNIYGTATVTKIVKTLLRIEYTGTLVKNTYFDTEEFDPTGLSFTAIYSNAEPEIIPSSDISWDALKAGDTKATGHYNSKDVEVSGITVNKDTINEVVISGKMEKTIYSTNDGSWSVDGLTVTAKYLSKKEIDVSSESTWTFDPPVPALGVEKVTLYATYNSIKSNEVSFDVSVRDVIDATDTLNINTFNSTTSYKTYTNISKAGGNAGINSSSIYEGYLMKSTKSSGVEYSTMQFQKNSSYLDNTFSRGTIKSITVNWCAYPGASSSAYYEIYSKENADEEITEDNLLGEYYYDSENLVNEITGFGNNKYFEFAFAGGTSYIKSIIVNYEEPKPQITSIEVTKNPTKTTYNAGTDFETDGLEISAIYDNEPLTATPITGWTITDGTNLQKGTSYVTASYDDPSTGKTFTCQVPITVIDAAPVKAPVIDQGKRKTVFDPREPFSLGCTYKVDMSDGTTKTGLTLEDFTVYYIKADSASGLDWSKASVLSSPYSLLTFNGTYQIRLSYTSGGVTKNVSAYGINVYDISDIQDINVDSELGFKCSAGGASVSDVKVRFSVEFDESIIPSNVDKKDVKFGFFIGFGSEFIDLSKVSEYNFEEAEKKLTGTEEGQLGMTELGPSSSSAKDGKFKFNFICNFSLLGMKDKITCAFFVKLGDNIVLSEAKNTSVNDLTYDWWLEAAEEDPESELCKALETLFDMSW